MSNAPIIKADGHSENNASRPHFLANLYEATSMHIRHAREEVTEVDYEPGTIKRISHTQTSTVVYWSDPVSMDCFLGAFQAAWHDLGDETLVEHLVLAEYRDKQILTIGGWH